ncbi:MAG: orotidine-5'-phosphate decarboxylase [Candidatus Roizmanbacteria bacterium]|nr:orotidine-5'-phosphate decarboxylase [Candidatus Roizmanbacteria bacterium]
MNIYSKLNSIIDKNNSMVCVGLDSAMEKIPTHLQKERYPQYAFNKALIDATADLVCAYKPNSAFYEARGEAGMKELKMTFDYIHNKYPNVLTILDAKRADIGSTNEGYAKYIFDYLGADCVTLHPYLGKEALKPFLARKNKGSIILCRTSNPGAGEFQDLIIDGEPLYLKVAGHVKKDWNRNNNCLLVVGATYPEEMKKIRSLVGDTPFLVPGIGAQGGDIEKAVTYGRDRNGKGIIINSGRNVIFASNKEDFALKARKEVEKLKDEINKYR